MESQATCGNCGGTELYEKSVSSSGVYGPHLLPIGIISLFSGPTFKIRVCGECGFVAWFVPEKYMDKLKAKFDKVQ